MNLNEYVENSCTCKNCVNMCKHRPCWPTPDESKKIIEAGFADKLMLDYWEGLPNIYIVSPAIVGYEKQNAPYRPVGKCSFLKDDLCTLHDLKLKPFEGRMVKCGDHKIDLHHDVAMTWKCEEGKEVVKFWKEKIQFVENDD